jgi:hypothetical protein
MDFSRRIDDVSLGFIEEPEVDAEVALLAFGGIKGGLGVPPYEFFRITEGLPARRLFVRDLDEDAAAGIRDALTGIRRTVAVGNSAGGFGAILLGTLAGVDEVHVFSPQTAIDRRHRVRWLDLRWPRQMFHVRRLAKISPNHLDLRVLLEARSSVPRIHVHYCGTHGRDVAHARHLEGLPTVTLHEHPGRSGHRLVTELRDRGELQPMLRRALGS